MVVFLSIYFFFSEVWLYKNTTILLKIKYRQEYNHTSEEKKKNLDKNTTILLKIKYRGFFFFFFFFFFRSMVVFLSIFYFQKYGCILV
jgi:hypothetical protein